MPPLGKISNTREAESAEALLARTEVARSQLQTSSGL
jgi:hypothetical protein